MPIDQLPPWFLPLFFTAFVAVCVYLACVLALMTRLKSPALRARGYSALDFSSAGGFFRLLRFLAGDQHRQLGDPAISRLVWGARISLLVYLPLFILVVLVILVVRASAGHV